MRMFTRRISPLALLVLVAACDGHAATAPTDGHLSQADAGALNRAIFATGASYAGGTVPAGARGTRAVGPDGIGTFSFTLNTVQPCTPSGNVAVAGALSGSFDGVAETARVQANLGVTHHDCTIVAGQGGTFRLNGDPRIDVTLSAAGGPGGASELHLTEVGAFTWEHQGSSGRCEVNVTADLVDGTQTVKLAGSFCGWPVDATVPVSG
jgi:hypothetical protein